MTTHNIMPNNMMMSEPKQDNLGYYALLVSALPLLFFSAAVKAMLFGAHEEGMSLVTDYRVLVTATYIVLAVPLVFNRFLGGFDKNLSSMLIICGALFFFVLLVQMARIMHETEYSVQKANLFAMGAVTVIVVVFYLSIDIFAVRSILVRSSPFVCLVFALMLMVSITSGNAFQKEISDIDIYESYVPQIYGSLAIAAAFAYCAICNLLGMIKHEKKWLRYGLSLVLAVGCLIFTQSRGALIIFVIFGSAIIYLNYKKDHFYKYIYLALLASVVVGYIIYTHYELFELVIDYLVARYHGESMDSGVNYRQSAISVAWGMNVESPLLGQGFGSFEKNYRLVYPHNIVLELLAEWGVIGLFIFGAPVFLIFITYIKKLSGYIKDDPLFYGALLFLALSLKEGGLENVSLILIFVSALFLESRASPVIKASSTQPIIQARA